MPIWFHSVRSQCSCSCCYSLESHSERCGAADSKMPSYMSVGLGGVGHHEHDLVRTAEARKIGWSEHPGPWIRIPPSLPTRKNP